MRRLPLAPIALCLAALCWGGSGEAGPWMREKGAVFLSFGHESGAENQHWSSLYAEYGLGARHTVILDYGRGAVSEELWLGWQIPLLPQDWTQKLTLGTWIGERKLDGEGAQMYGLGLNWGMGFTEPIWRKNGWLSADLRHMRAPVEISYDPAAEGIDPMTLPDPSHLPAKSFTKLDLTAGLHLDERWMAFGQLQLYKPDNDDLSQTLAASVVRSLGVSQLQLGLTLPLQEDADPRAKLGLWLSF